MSEKYEYKVTAAGRINIIGEHVDYCGGKVMPAAISLKNAVYIRPNGTNKINLRWTTLSDKVTLDIDKLESYKGLKYGNYQAGFCLEPQYCPNAINMQGFDKPVLRKVKSKNII